MNNEGKHDIARIIDESCKEIQGISLAKRLNQINEINQKLYTMHFNLEMAYACIEFSILELEYLSLTDATGKTKKMWEYAI